MNPLKQFIEKYTDLSDRDWVLIENSFERKEFLKDELILEEGKICRFFCFLEVGLVRFFINHEGEDLTTYFVDAPYCFTAKKSFHETVPSKENIQALSRCVIWQTTLDKIQYLSHMPSWERFTRNFIHEVQGYIEQLLITNKTLSAEVRYLKLLEVHPDLTNRVPLKYLAGFLGIAPQSLSRIRKKHQNK
ncbi:MAG: Crp/Fnr family transcriptional regulator [Candidatus Moranbacteria bacterium]|nr:Crp/Fnr family transcriptional regulator [Candidatus Moranbacteria bacterium]